MPFNYDLLVTVGAQIDDYEDRMKDVQAIADKMERKLEDVGRRLTAGITVPLGLAAAAATKFGADFQKEMTKSTAIMGNLSEEMKRQMENTAMEVAAQTDFSASQAAAAYFYLASAGLNAAQSLGALPTVSKFATAGQFDLALATDLLTDAQSALGLTVKDTAKNMQNMNKVSDVLVKANTLSNATVQQFSESLTNKAGAALRLLNKDITEGVAVLAVYADQGLKGAAAGDALNIVMRDLQRAALKNRAAFQNAGIAVFDANGKMRNMADIILALETRLGTMSDEQKRAELTMLGFQDKSVAATLALVGTSDKIREYEQRLRSAAGTTDEVANKQMENFWSKLGKLYSRLQNAVIRIFPAWENALNTFVLTPLSWLVRGVEIAGNAFNMLSKPVQLAAVAFGGVLAAIGPFLITAGALVGTLMAMKGLWAFVGIAIKAVLPAFLSMAAAAGLVLIKVAAVAAIGAFLVANWNKVKGLMQGIFTGIVFAANWAWLQIVKGIGWVVQKIPFLSRVFGQVEANATMATDAMGQKFTEAAANMSASGDWIGNTTTYLGNLMDQLTMKVKANGDALKGWGEGTGETATLVTEKLNFLQQFFSDWAGNMKAAADSLSEGISGAFMEFTTSMVSSLAQGTFDAKKAFLDLTVKLLEMSVSFAIAQMGIFQTISKAIAAAFANPLVAIAAIAGLIGAVGAMSASYKGSVAMANGGMTTGPTNALLGDNKSGKEAVLPLDNPRATSAVAAAIDNNRGGGEGTFIAQIDGDTLIKAVLKRLPGAMRREGVSFVS